MNWQDLLNPAIQNFIKTHKNADVKELALKKPPHEDWNYPLILDQIKAHRKIGKIPPFDKEGIILPSADLIEQASSWACAQYKAGLYEGDLFIDLAAGSGADTFAFSKKFKRGVAVEKDKISADILAHNLDVLNTSHITIYNQPAENFVTDMPKANLVYCDPQRRNTQKRGIYDLSKCSPDIPSLLKVLKAQKVLIKTSPVLDIHKTVH
ncbi:MAG: RsmD family RNA methyltransferase, partial [Alphaproteobacteria bacterium]